MCLCEFDPLNELTNQKVLEKTTENHIDVVVYRSCSKHAFCNSDQSVCLCFFWLFCSLARVGLLRPGYIVMNLEE